LTGSARSLAYQPAIDGMRGLAVLAVLFFHAGHLQGGFLGVDLFFTVSGYLITSLLLAERDGTGRISLPAFWGRRARRLLPALFVLIAAVLIVYAIWGAPGQAEQLRDPGLAGLFYVANWQAIAGDGYWALFSAPSPFEHVWSLAIEEQFYLLWPFVVVLVLVFLGVRRGPRTLAIVAGAAAVVSAVLMAVYAGSDIERAYLGTDSRLGSILIGAVVAVLLHRPVLPLQTEAARRALVTSAWTCAALLAVIWVAFDGNDMLLYRGGFTVHALAVAVIIVAITLHPGTVLGRALSWRPLVAIGLISYGLYLWHWPVFVWMNPDRMGFSGWGLTAVRFAVAFGLAYASYRLIERPIRRGALRPRIAIPAAVATAVALAVAVLVVSRPPDPDELVTGTALAPTGAATTSATTPSTTVPASTNVATSVVSSSTTPTTPPTTPPTTAATSPPTTAGPTLSDLVRIVPSAPAPLRQPTPDNPLRVALFGDSYMYDAAPGIEAALEATGLVQVEDRSVLGFGLAKDDWAEHVNDAIDDAPELVVTMWARFDVGLVEERGAPEFAARLQEAASMLLSRGAQLVVVGLAPSELGFGRHDLVSRGINDVFAGLPSVFPGRVTYLDPDPLVAPDGVPRLTIPVPGGELRVRKIDLGHYCPDGAARFGQALVEIVGVAARVPPPTAPWYAGPWRQDGRYDDPPGACR
jgi:peptidoglycan/LPS O-acetylase OafA/YrhL